MRKRCLLLQQRAISEMASYVLAVVIVVVLAVMTYAFLELLVPKAKATCDEERLLTLDLSKISCTVFPQDTTKQKPREIGLNLTLVNTGKRSVSGVYIRLGPTDRKVRTLLNANDIFFGFIPESPQPDQLAPGHALSKNFTLSDKTLLDSILSTPSGQQPLSYPLVLEIQPLLGKPGATALCERAIVVQPLSCPLAQPIP